MKREKGQSLVELSVGLVILSILLMGILDIGRAFFTHVALEDVAGEAALYYAIYSDCEYDEIVDGQKVADNEIEDGCDAPDNALWRAQNSVNDSINWDKVDITFSKIYSEECQCYYAHADMTYEFTFLTPTIRAITETLTLHTHASEVIMIQ